MSKLYLIFLLVCAHIISAAQTILMPVDAGSKVHFTIKNFGINTGGDFTGLNGGIVFDPNNLAASNFNVTVETASINTGNKKRDNHLRKAEYFDVETYPRIHFKSTKVSSYTKDIYLMEGNINMKGVRKLISFPFKVTPQDGGYLFQGLFEINRRDFGVGGNSAVMGDNVKVTLDVFAK